MVSELTTFISLIFGKTFDLFLGDNKNKQIRKILNTKEIESIIEKLDDNFKNEFIYPDFKENYFYAQTGISTNSNSIKKYIELKNRLGNNYTWKDIKLIKTFLEFKDDLLIIKISKFQSNLGKILLALSILFILTGFYIFMFLFDSNSLSWIAKGILSVIPVICGFYLFISIYPTIMASNMKKRLDSVL